MGKFMRKTKLTSDIVSIMEVTQLTLGVRTRAKTLALQKLQASKTTGEKSPEKNDELSFLQLRSRRLVKLPLPQSICCRQRNPNNRNCKIETECVGETEDFCDIVSEEASTGENNIEFDGRERSSRESTPCSFIRDSSDSITPGSSTKPKNRNSSSQILQNSVHRIMPSAQEIEEFFSHHALEQQRCFFEKYNFDIVNEKLIQGRYEWVKVQP